MSSLRLWSLACLGLAVGGCSPTPTEGPDAPAPNLGKVKPPSLPTVTVTITPTSPGLLPDGSPYVVTPGSDGSVEVRPACSTRSIDLQGMVPAIDALDRSTCNGNRGAGYVFLKFPGLMTAGSGACPGDTAPQQTVNGLNFGVTSRYYFVVDSDGDGRYDDTGYTLVLTDCQVAVSGSTRTVTATTANLWQNGITAGPVLTGTPFQVNLTVTQ